VKNIAMCSYWSPLFCHMTVVHEPLCQLQQNMNTRHNDNCNSICIMYGYVYYLQELIVVILTWWFDTFYQLMELFLTYDRWVATRLFGSFAKMQRRTDCLICWTAVEECWIMSAVVKVDIIRGCKIKKWHV
jgi:hypothetical protein